MLVASVSMKCWSCEQAIGNRPGGWPAGCLAGWHAWPVLTVLCTSKDVTAALLLDTHYEKRGCAAYAIDRFSETSHKVMESGGIYHLFFSTFCTSRCLLSSLAT